MQPGSTQQRQLAAFRQAQFAGPHPAVAAQGSAAAAAAVAEAQGSDTGITPDSSRVILHFDADSFYAQVEENRNPALRGRPIGVTQKYLIVTCNYEARRAGVTKLMGIAEARQKCPSLVLVSGEDLTPYRQASKAILSVLQRFGTAERLGLDEVWVDATAEVRRRISEGRYERRWHGHVHSSQVSLVQDSRHRPMDLRAQQPAQQQAQQAQHGPEHAPQPGPAQQRAAAPVLAGEEEAGSLGSGSPGGEPGPSSGSGWELLLMVGSAVAAEARAAVKAEAGYRTSAGIACNKMLAKLVSGLHKPDDQTVLPPPQAAGFVAPLPPRALPGVGHKLDQELAGLGIASAVQLRGWTPEELARRFGSRVGTFLYSACRGQDPSPVQERGPPKSVSVEDSFKSCAGLAAARRVLEVLAPDLLARLREEAGENSRRGQTLTLTWRHKAQGFKRSSASCPMPQAVLSAHTPEPEQAAALVAASLALLKKHLGTAPFDLTLLNLAATNFKPCQPGGGGGAGAGSGRSVAELLQLQQGGGGGSGGGGVAGARVAPATQHGQQQAQQGGMGAWAAMPAPLATAAAAEQSATARRDYGAGDGTAPQLLSKRRERELREGDSAAAAGAAGTAAGAPWSSGGGAGGAGLWQGLGHSSSGSGLAGEGGIEEEEEEDGFWDGLWDDEVRPGPGLRRRASLKGPAPPPSSVLAGDAAAATRASAVAAPAPGSNPSGLHSSAAGEGQLQQGGRVIIHCDVDAYYCQVEVLDDPSLRCAPLAVQQFNGGGFVAVSYEARAAGIRCGDGAGAAGRASVPHLRAMQAMSVEECRRRCPALQVRPMRTDRYRQVAQQIQGILQRFAPGGEVEKTSYDDFYLDVTAACSNSSSAGPAEAQLAAPPTSLRFATPPGDSIMQPPGAAAGSAEAAAKWAQLAPDLRRGVALAAALRAAIAAELGGMTLSCGVARTKLAARQAGPLHKPDGLTALADGDELGFVRSVPLRKIPSLRGKFGQEVEAVLGARLVGDLLPFPPADLAARFGAQRGTFLAALPHAEDPSPVRERGPPKSVSCERSFPPTSDPAALRAACGELVRALLPRLQEDFAKTGRPPAKLALAFRLGYANPRSKSCAAPAALLSWLRASCNSEAGGGTAAASTAQAPPSHQRQQQQQQQGGQQGQAALVGPAEAAQATVTAPGAALSWPPTLEGSLVEAYLAMLPPKEEGGISRLSLGVAFPDAAGGGGSGRGALGGPPGQAPISGFLLASTGRQHAVPAACRSGCGSAAGEGLGKVQGGYQQAAAASAPHPASFEQQQQQQQQQQGQQGPPPQLPPPPQAQRATASAAAKPTYRNPEAVALQRLFACPGLSAHPGIATASAGSGNAGSGDPMAAGSGAVGAGEGVSQGMTQEERESYDLALRLQMEEVQGAAAGTAKGGGGERQGGKKGTGGSGRKRPGPSQSNLEFFFKRGKSYK